MFATNLPKYELITEQLVPGHSFQLRPLKRHNIEHYGIMAGWKRLHLGHSQVPSAE